LRCFLDGGENAASLDDVFAKLTMLEGSRFMNVCGESNAGVWRTCHEYCSTLIKGNIPDWKKLGNGDFAVKLKLALLNAVTSGEAPNVHRGKQALGHMLEMLVASMDGGHPPTYASTLRIRQLASFLDKASHDILKRLTDQLVVGVSISKASSGASSSGVASSKVVKKRVR
jgi:hypothetical protein